MGQFGDSGNFRSSERGREITRVLTIGHGTLDAAGFAALVRAARIERIADVRSVPRSRAHPHFWKERMGAWIPDLAGANYDWRPALGGFRKPRPESLNTSLRHPSFRGYADYMETDDFVNALTDLVRDAGAQELAIMCSETLWWRCHRRLISDALVLLHGAEVRHLMHDATLKEHRLTQGVRRVSNATLRYDGESW